MGWLFVDPSIDNSGWYKVYETNMDAFVQGMLSMGTPVGVSLVGDFGETEGLGSRRDVDLPLHQDGVHSEELAKVQGGIYVENPEIDIVGLYCLQEGEGTCRTVLVPASVFVQGAPVDLMICNGTQLQKGEAVVFDNRKLMHGREGRLQGRILLRMWIKRK